MDWQSLACGLKSLAKFPAQTALLHRLFVLAAIHSGEIIQNGYSPASHKDHNEKVDITKKT